MRVLETQAETSRVPVSSSHCAESLGAQRRQSCWGTDALSFQESQVKKIVPSLDLACHKSSKKEQRQ